MQKLFSIVTWIGPDHLDIHMYYSPSINAVYTVPALPGPNWLNFIDDLIAIRDTTINQLSGFDASFQL